MLPLIPTRVHGLLDYATGLLLLALPWLLGAAGLREAAVPMTLGAAVLVTSLCTDYELGVVRRVPMPLHLVLDAVGGAILIYYGWAAGPNRSETGGGVLPFVAVGLFVMASAFLTRIVPGDRTSGRV